MKRISAECRDYIAQERLHGMNDMLLADRSPYNPLPFTCVCTQGRPDEFWLLLLQACRQKRMRRPVKLSGAFGQVHWAFTVTDLGRMYTLLRRIPNGIDSMLNEFESFVTSAGRQTMSTLDDLVCGWYTPTPLSWRQRPSFVILVIAWELMGKLAIMLALFVQRCLKRHVLSA